MQLSNITVRFDLRGNAIVTYSVSGNTGSTATVNKTYFDNIKVACEQLKSVIG